VLDLLERWAAVGDTSSHAAIRRPELLDLVVRNPARALDRAAQLLHKRPERAPLLGDARIVAVDHDQLRHRLARYRLAFARAPVAHLAHRLGDLVDAVVAQRRGDQVATLAEMPLGEFGEPLRDAPERIPIGLALPRRRDRLVERVDERMQVGRT